MVRHTPATRRWTRTGTFAAQAVNPPAAVTTPLTTRCRRSAIEIDRSWAIDSTVKLAELVAVPPAVVTLILPDTAPAGTVAVILVAELTEKVVAATPPNFTEVAPVKAVPLMVTTVPTGPLVGVNEVIVGAVVTVKSEALVAVPPGVVTVIFPVTAPLGTVAVTRVPAPFTENVVAATPPNFTEVAPPKFVPLIVTEVPTGPLVGVKDVIVGVAEVVTVKSDALVAVPPGVVTVIFPVTATRRIVAGCLVAEAVNEQFVVAL